MISKILAGRKTSEVVENTDELSFGEGQVRIFFWVKDVNALHEEVINRGAAIAVPLETRSYEVRDFSIRDPNGVVVFGKLSATAHDFLEQSCAVAESLLSAVAGMIDILAPFLHIAMHIIQAEGVGHTKAAHFNRISLIDAHGR